MLMRRGPFVLNFSRTKTTIGLDLILHLAAISLASIAAAQLPSCMLNAYLTQASFTTFKHLRR